MKGAMAGRVVFAALAALLAASCKDDRVGGCGGTAVIIAVRVPVDAGTGTDADASTDGGSFSGRPGCSASCQQYLEALRVEIEGATGATCRQSTNRTELACVASPDWWCASGNVDAGGALETQIRDYLAAARPEIGADAVSLETCMCFRN